LFAYGFTATVEAQLDHVAQGLTPWKQVLQDMWSLYKERYQTLSSTSVTIATNKVKEFIIPNKGLIKAVQSKKGPLLLSEGKTKEDTVFYGWPSGIAFEDMTEAIAATFIQLKQSEKDGSIIGEYEGESIVKKTGKFGTYIQCGTVSIPYQEEAVEKIIEKLAAKKEVKQGEVTFKEYVIRTGQYGPYIMKTSLKKPQFVSLPKGVNPTTLTEKEVEALYKLGLEAKKSWKKEKKI
jgi:DNA topoisomerase-1